MRRLLLALLAISAAGLAPMAARAQDAVAEAVAGFSGDGYDETEAFLEALAATGDERALPIIDALEERQLYLNETTGEIFIAVEGEEDDTLVLSDPVTGEEIGVVPDDDYDDIRVNNRIRRAIASARGALTLMSENPGTRARAADQVFDSRDEASLEALRAAMEQEENERILTRMRQAEAAILLEEREASEAELVAAVEAVRGRGNRAALSLLTGVVNDEDISPALREAATEGVAALEQRLAMIEAVRNVWYGISLGSVLLLAATGLAITFGVMGVINMAHGELMMLGAYTTYVVQQVFIAAFPGAVDYALLAAVPAAFLVAGGAGVAIERGVIRFLYGRPLETLLATWGVSLILQQVVRSIFGPTNVQVSTPSWMTGTFDVVAGLSLTLNRVTIVIFTLAVFFGLMAVIQRTSFGLRMRAVTQNRRMANSVGIRSGWIDAMTFGLGSGVAGLAGVAISQIDNVSPNLGQSYIIDSFLVVVFGGVGNLWGTLVGALSLGVANKFLEPFAGAVLAKILILVAVILFIQRRPRGLFALRGRAVEA